MRTIDRQKTAERIKECRLLAELKQKDLAEITEISISTLQKLEYDGKGLRAWQQLFRISDALGVYPEDLIVWEEE